MYLNNNKGVKTANKQIRKLKKQNKVKLHFASTYILTISTIIYFIQIIFKRI